MPSSRVFLTQRLNPGLLHCRQILYCWATRETHLTCYPHLKSTANGKPTMPRVLWQATFKGLTTEYATSPLKNQCVCSVLQPLTIDLSIPLSLLLSSYTITKPPWKKPTDPTPPHFLLGLSNPLNNKATQEKRQGCCDHHLPLVCPASSP